jgi:hypothetical protein
LTRFPVRFQTYEFLPAISANLALLNLSDRHLGAASWSRVPLP